MIQFEILNGVGKITLNRPEKYRSFVREMALQLQDTFDKCNEDKSVRAILITATGKAFCAGQDLGEATDTNGPDLTQIVQEHYNPIIRKIRNMEKPVVAAVNGVAAGAGASIALPFMGGGGDEDDGPIDQMDPSAVTQRARNFYSGMGQKGVGLDFMPQKKYVNQNFYAADGGRAGYAGGGSLDEDEEDYVRSSAGMSRRQPTAFLNMGGGAGEAQAEQMLMAEFVKYKNKGGDLSFQQFVQAVMQQQEQSQGMEQPTMMAANGGMAGTSVPGYGTPAGTNQFGYPSGGTRVNAAEGGIMDTEEASEMIDMGGNEKDYRDEGGFVAMGGEERADDVPARLSKNEFVFTADAVRNAGGGDIDRGSEVMQNLMDNLEQGGQVSEESQGMGGGEEMMSEEIIEEPNGAQAMYEQQQALQSRMA